MTEQSGSGSLELVSIDGCDCQWQGSWAVVHRIIHHGGVHEIEVVGTESDCSYLPGRPSTLMYRLAYSLTESRYEQLLERGWRRFGRTLFRPACRSCQECRSIRVLIPDFQPSRSQRKCARRNEHLSVTVTAPSVTDRHLELYNAYHADMNERRQWPYRRINEEQYAESFLEGRFSFSREFRYYDGDQLIAVGLVDVTTQVMSSIYFFHDPAWRDAGLGTWSILQELAWGRDTGRRVLYLGYFIRDCISMNYKNRFQPHQLLQGYVADHESPHWRTPEERSSGPA